MKKYMLLFLPMLASMFSCQKEIKMDLNESHPKVVIEANYIASDSTVIVNVMSTSSYFDQFSTNYIVDAVVTIQEDNGTVTTIPFDGVNNYQLANYIPTYGAIYTLKVVVDGVDYLATCPLLPVMQLLPATYTFQEASIFGEEGYSLNFRFQDFPGKGNAYKLIPTYDGIRYYKFGEFLSGDDNLTDGNVIERPLFETFQLGDTIILELQSIHQKVYDYYSQLSSNTSSFTASNGNPDYMWSNDALGYFSAYGYSIDTVVIQ